MDRLSINDSDIDETFVQPESGQVLINPYTLMQNDEKNNFTSQQYIY